MQRITLREVSIAALVFARRAQRSRRRALGAQSGKVAIDDQVSITYRSQVTTTSELTTTGMHTCLGIEELVSLVCQYLPNESLYSLARTSRALSGE